MAAPLPVQPPVAARAVTSRDPATGEIWRRFDATTSDQVGAALAAARAAQPAWGQTPLHLRARHLEQFRRLLFERRQEVANTIERENGKPPIEALTEVLLALDFARHYSARSVLRVLEDQRRGATAVALWRKTITITHEPIGVVGVIAPWNYPLMLSAGIILPALVAGNAVLFKPSEFTTQTGMLLAELLHQAGIPEGVVRTLPGAGSTGASLITHGCDKIFFTGSEATGRAVASECAARLTPYVLELGGSDPAIVLDDANLERAAEGVTWGRFSNSGQTCVAPKRLFVHEAVYDEFCLLLTRQIQAVRPGLDRDTSDVGPLIRPEQTAKIESQLDDAMSRGARVVARATAAAEGVFAPVLLANITPEMRVLREETFGPVLPIVRVRDDAEAVARANDSPYGLSASVWSEDNARARAVATRLHAGTVAINDVLITAGMPDVPHGGVKASGTGRSHGIHGLLECVQSKAIVDERFPALRQVWWFPYWSGVADALDAFVTAVHGHGLVTRSLAAWRARRLLGRHRP
jgi:acyl-CoA reductase-like NAD-dependent aldehyde dehydrogenase